MFEKIGRLAETAANQVSVSRRGFLGRLGQSALGVAGVLAGMTTALAQSSGTVSCCKYSAAKAYGCLGRGTFSICLPGGGGCPATYFVPEGCPGRLRSTSYKTDCSKC
jgi:hypothetical protein